MKEFFKKKSVKYAAGILIVVVVGLSLYKSPVVQNKLTAKTIVEKTAIVKKGDIKLLVSGTGNVYYDKTASISSKVSSKVINVYFKEGDRVKAGDLICDFDDTTAKLSVNQMKNTLVQNQLSNKMNAIQLDKLTIETPFPGQISNIAVKQGDVVQKGATLFNIADTSKLKLTVEFNAADIDKISVNQSANVNLTSLMQSTSGIVTYKSNKAISTNAGGQLYTVEIQINNPGAVTEGMSATASIETPRGSLASTNAGTLEYINKTPVISETGGTINSISIKKNQQVGVGEKVIIMKNDDVKISKEIGDSKITDSQIQIASLENQLGYYKIYAPIDGVIAKQSMSVGNSVNIGDSVITIKAENAVQVDVDIDELDIAKVTIGQKVQLTVDAVTETAQKPIEGEVVKISLDGASKNGVTNFTVTVRVKERLEMLRGGMNVSADIDVKNIVSVLYLPKEAITKSEGKSIVIVKGNEENNISKEIEIGASNGSFIEIKNGLKEGDIIILPQS